MVNGGVPVETTTEPETRRRMQAGGPMAFILALKQTLERLNRPYLFSGAVPYELQAAAADAQNTSAGFEERYEEMRDQSPRRDLRQVPHAIIHQYRQYPAKTGEGTPSDSPAGAGRQKKPLTSFYHDRPLPNSPREDDAQLRPAVGESGDKPPLWDSMEQVPDMIRPHIEPETMMYVTMWDFEVYVDLALVAANVHLLTDMKRDVLTILKTFHERWATGASNLSGWFYQLVSGAPPEIDDDLRGDYPAATLTWRLQQTQAYAFPIRELTKIEYSVHGRKYRDFGGLPQSDT